MTLRLDELELDDLQPDLHLDLHLDLDDVGLG
jgi:hypothetical protein